MVHTLCTLSKKKNMFYANIAFTIFSFIDKPWKTSKNIASVPGITCLRFLTTYKAEIECFFITGTFSKKVAFGAILSCYESIVSYVLCPRQCLVQNSILILLLFIDNGSHTLCSFTEKNMLHANIAFTLS